MRMFSRREFMETGAKGMAVASIPIFFKFNPMNAFASPAGGLVTGELLLVDGGWTAQ